MLRLRDCLEMIFISSHIISSWWDGMGLKCELRLRHGWIPSHFIPSHCISSIHTSIPYHFISSACYSQTPNANKKRHLWVKNLHSQWKVDVICSCSWCCTHPYMCQGGDCKKLLIRKLSSNLHLWLFPALSWSTLFILAPEIFRNFGSQLLFSLSLQINSYEATLLVWLSQ